MLGLALGLAIQGCGGSDPELGEFQIPSRVTVGDEVEATLAVYDEDGLGEMLFTVLMQNSEVSHEVFHSVTGDEEVTTGDLSLFLGFFVPGTYSVSVTVTDEDGHESNAVSAIVTADPEVIP